jgi:hypothetical protein
MPLTSSLLHERESLDVMADGSLTAPRRSCGCLEKLVKPASHLSEIGQCPVQIFNLSAYQLEHVRTWAAP